METQLTWFGQSAFKIVSPAGKVLLIDPWLTNPVYDGGKDELSSLKNVDLILVSHGHSDHVGNAVEIGKKTRAKLVATFDLSSPFAMDRQFITRAIQIYFRTWRWCRNLTRSTSCSFALATILRWDLRARLKR